MSTPKVIRATQHLLQQVSRIAHGLTKRFVSWLLRSLLLFGRPSLSRAGFVLPTTVLLLLVVVLTVGAISYRTFTRTQQAITERQQQVVYNAATPVIDRAKSKLEFLFDPEKDSRGGGVPSQTQLLGMMLNDGRVLEGGTQVPRFPPGADVDPYTFEGETRIDVNGDGQRDNAWRYRVDLNGDGNVNSPGNVDGWAVYSIIFSAPLNNQDALRDARPTAWRTRANALQVRNAPLSNASQVNNICQRDEGGSDRTPLINGEGWFPDQTNTTKIRKNFQVNAYVVPDNPNGTVATLEFQQDREATQGFKWAAWFRNDLEIFPGPRFNWNGAMHTEGNLIVGGGSSFRGYLVSSPQSCINSKDASEITARENERNDETGVPDFKGRFITGTIRDNNFDGTPSFDPHPQGEPSIPMPAAADSVDPGSLRPIDFSLEPVVLQTEGRSRPRNPAVLSTTNNAATWPNGPLNQAGNGRIRNIPDISTPYLDDTYRADNRWGPKPTWGREQLPIGVTDASTASGGPTVKIGDPIVGIPALAQSDLAPGADSEGVGLDGYWERRARLDGMRVIVGQRLELGDPAGWGGPGGGSGSEAFINENVPAEPLRPWPRGCSGNDCNMDRQRRSQWDNLAAVQATAIYHNATDTTPDQRDFPDACLISTSHPGTPGTLDRSSTFENLAYGLPANAIPGYTNQTNPTIITDVFRGRGTNGWEFSAPNLADFRNNSSSLMIALRNLAYFAGDPLGGTPSFKPSQIAGQQVHPYPSMAMWGDFSNLRQVFKLLDGGTNYDALSPADKTTLHTAACTMGMLAYNVDYLEKLKVYDPTPANDPTLNGTFPRTLVGFTDTEVATASGTGTTLNLTIPATLARLEYSQGLRGRIRVIDHILRGYLRPANATSIPVALRPPDSFITNIQGLNTAGNSAMQFMSWDSDKSNNPETYVRLLERWRDDVNTPAAQKDELNQIISLAQLIITKEQVARDRTWGFRGAYGTTGEQGLVSTWPLGDCGVTIGGTNTPAGGWLLQPKTLTLQATNYNAAGNPVVTIPATETDPLLNPFPDPLHRLCSVRPRYPILYSLFPAKLTNAVTPPATIDALYQPGGAINHGDLAEVGEQGVRDRQDRTARIARYIATENASANYQVVRPSAIALQPLTLTQSGVTLGTTRAWTLPAGPGTPGTGSTPNNNRFNLIKICSTRCSQPANVNTTFQRPVNGTLVRVAFKDGSFFNGREMLPVRTLDLDLDLMKRTTYGSDLWLPKKGIIYAFREDAVSESSLVRPNGANTWPQCNTDAELNSATCAMRTGDVTAFDSTDPPINAANFITAKPVDYYPDPDRRPNGFRLRQGENLKRDGDEGRGLSFISDNPVYIQGNFNLHQDASRNLLEEFTQQLDASYSNFYTRSELDLSFADRDDDQWRPSEVIADAVTLISDNFCDGSIEDGFSNLGANTLPTWLQNRYGCTGSTTVTSYLNQNRPRTAVVNDATRQRAVTWVRTNVADSFPGAQRPQTSGRNIDEGESPILITPLGRPVQWNDLAGTNAFYSGAYVATNTNKPLMGALNNTRMNLIMVSGLVPSRVGQSYGGLHNFPRFLENWDGQNLFISGAFLQLNFSNYATAPFDQEGWQFGSPAPATGANANEWIRYYSPPNRRWGYDVGLQYAPAGPVAQRFQFAEDTRSEFYSEPPANDPYIFNLCRQVPGRAASCPAPTP